MSSTTSRRVGEFTATVRDHATTSAAITSGGRIIAGPSVDADTIISAALYAGAQVVVWVTGPGDVAPQHPSVVTFDSAVALTEDALFGYGDEAVVVLDQASLNPFGNPGDRFALLGAAPDAAATIRRVGG